MIAERMRRDRRHARLLAAARGGDTEAFRRLYREIVVPVGRYLSARVTDSDTVEDLTSQVLHRFLERLGDYRGGRGSVMSWVLTMAHHALVDHWRAGRSMVPLENVPERPADATPLDQLVADERAGMARALLADLDDELRQMFELRFGHGLKHREIADLLGLSESTVKQRLSRAIRRIRTHLAADRTRQGGVQREC